MTLDEDKFSYKKTLRFDVFVIYVILTLLPIHLVDKISLILKFHNNNNSCYLILLPRRIKISSDFILAILGN